MTPEQAAENAAQTLQQAREHFLDGQAAAALVQVVDGWTRLHTALANAPKTIEPAPGEPAPLGYVLVQGGGDYWELCAHGPDPIDPDPERLRAVLHQGKLDSRSSYMLCKLVPIA